jgi:ferredoxin
MAEISKVSIDADECISCEACVDACPEVFEMNDDTCVVKAEAQNADFVKAHGDAIIEAAEGCPVDAIKYE